MVIVLLWALAIYSLFTYRDFIMKHKNVILITVAVLLSWTQLVRYGIVVIRDGFILDQHLPFYVCRLSVVVLLYYVITKDKRVESFLFYWGATGIAGVIYPNGPIDNIINLTETFYIDHFLLGLSPFFLVIYQGYKPVKSDLFKITGVMFIMLLVFIPLNNIMDTDYFYLKDRSIVGVIFPNLPTQILGIPFKDLPSVIFAAIHSVVALGFFSLYYFAFKDKKYI
jgi:hypothetical integral membrane protein (TIGR02206 family)